MIEPVVPVGGRSSAGAAEGPASICWAPVTTDQPLDAHTQAAGPTRRGCAVLHARGAEHADGNLETVEILQLPAHAKHRRGALLRNGYTEKTRGGGRKTAWRVRSHTSARYHIVFPRSAASAGSVPDACRGRCAPLPSRERAQPRSRARASRLSARPRPARRQVLLPVCAGQEGPARQDLARSTHGREEGAQGAGRRHQHPRVDPAHREPLGTPAPVPARRPHRGEPQRHRCTRTLRPQARAAWPPCACWRAR